MNVYPGRHVRPSLPVRLVSIPARLLSRCVLRYMGVRAGCPR